MYDKYIKPGVTVKLADFYVLVENRLNVIVPKYSAAVQQRINQDKSVPNHADAEHVINNIWRMDPSHNGKYVQWILNQYVKRAFRWEDVGNVMDDLEFFHTNKRQFTVKDIGKYNVQTLSDAVQSAQNTMVDQQSNKEKERAAKKNAKKIYEDDKLLVIVPQTEEAACYYGKGTKWCTAATNYNMFDRYNKEGPLYIIFLKNDRRKYQLHLPSRQLMDETDSRVSVAELVNKVPAILNAIPGIKDTFKAVTLTADELSKLSVNDVYQILNDIILDIQEDESDMMMGLNLGDDSALRKFLQEYTYFISNTPVDVLAQALLTIAKNSGLNDAAEYNWNDVAIVTLFSYVMDSILARNNYPADNSISPAQVNKLSKLIDDIASQIDNSDIYDFNSEYYD